MAAQLRDSKLDFWINNNLNVLFKGKHGVGKTASVIQAFDRNKLKWKYFSAATMDPFVDFIGVPKEVKDENGNSYLDLIRPKAFQDDEVEALFFDEYNRCLTGDTLIPLADGKSVPIQELIKRDKFYVYSYDVEKKKVVIGKGHSARKTGEKQKILRITLDNGKEIKCTEDHPFLLRKGDYCEAKDLKVGSSLMPLYRQLSEGKKLSLNGYEEVYHPESNKWEFTHRIADQYNLDTSIYKASRGKVRHHIDFNKLNNSPENIQRVGWTEHKLLHKHTGANGGRAAHKKHPDLYQRTIGNKKSQEKALKNSLAARASSPTYKKLRSDLSKKNFDTPEKRKKQAERCKKQWETGNFSFDQKKAHHKRTKTIAINFGVKLLNAQKKITPEVYETERKKIKGSGKAPINIIKVKDYFESFDNFATKVKEALANNNHKVVKIEVAGFEDVYDISVDNYYNFALEVGVFVHNSHKKVRNAVMELIQFKSINGRKFHNLKIIWAAVNPDDDETEDYDVEKIDPAQLDRFHVHVDVPYKPVLSYFVRQYGKEVAEAGCAWWSELPTEMKNAVSPRRLDYALNMYKNKGDLRDVLPSKSNINKLLLTLRDGPIRKKLEKFVKLKDLVGATKFLGQENNYAASISYLTKTTEFKKFFLPLLPEEKIASLIAASKPLQKYFAENCGKVAVYEKVINSIIKANQNKLLIRNLKKHIPKSIKRRSSGVPWAKQIKTLHGKSRYNTQQRVKIYQELLVDMPDNMTCKEAEATIDLVNSIMDRSHGYTIPRSFPKIPTILSTCFSVVARDTQYKTIDDIIGYRNWYAISQKLGASKSKIKIETLAPYAPIGAKAPVTAIKIKQLVRSSNSLEDLIDSLEFDDEDDQDPPF